MIRDVIATLKLKHWIKNLIIYVPSVFSPDAGTFNMFVFSTFGVLSFCFISSSVYILNDVIDIKDDQKHPIKKKRPIASHKIKLKEALFICMVLVFSGLIIGYKLNLYVGNLLVLYIILNIFYSFTLKHIAIIDVVCIAIGFIIRILVGCIIAYVYPFPLLLLVTFFISLFFSFSKRKLEYNLTKNEGEILTRKSLRAYNEDLLNKLVVVDALLAIIVYFVCVSDANVITVLGGGERLYLSAIVFFVIILRLLFLIFTNKKTDDPADFFYKDVVLQVLLAGLLLFYIIQ